VIVEEVVQRDLRLDRFRGRIARLMDVNGDEIGFVSFESSQWHESGGFFHWRKTRSEETLSWVVVFDDPLREPDDGIEDDVESLIVNLEQMDFPYRDEAYPFRLKWLSPEEEALVRENVFDVES